MHSENGKYSYQDLRTEEEKKSKIWVTIIEDKEKDISVSKNILWEKKTAKKW